MPKINEKCSDFLLVELSHAYMRAATSRDLLSGAKARKRAGEFVNKLEINYNTDMANLEAAARVFTQAYLAEHASHVEGGEIIWKTPLDD